MSNTVYITRVVRHSIDKVFDALTNPELVLQWFGPIEMETTSANIDLKVGGEYTFVIQRPDGSDFRIRGEYKEISPPEKLVFTAQYTGLGNASDIISIVNIDLRVTDNGTEISLSQAFDLIPADIERRTKSWELMFERIEALKF